VVNPNKRKKIKVKNKKFMIKLIKKKTWKNSNEN